MPLKPGSASTPFFGIKPVIVDQEGKVLEGACEGNLCIDASWPGMLRTLWGNHDRFKQGYFGPYPRSLFHWRRLPPRRRRLLLDHGPRRRRFERRRASPFSTAEIESALVAHPKVAEAAVVGCPHDIKGQGVYAYVTLKTSEATSDELRRELIQWVRKEIGPIATPDFIQWAPGLPKTRSGKIMRRILRKIAANEIDSLGDTSTLADPAWWMSWSKIVRVELIHQHGSL